ETKYYVVKGHPKYNQRPTKNVTVVRNNNRPTRVIQKNVTRLAQNNGRSQDNNGRDGRPERNNNQGRGNGRH
ncbi:hypothetical protein, partial [Pedobacter ginsenosidimutans]|uniref:hypothetical protein n=1 Tax=Pedobacter ginsenosidimutans TaxID=687842 RepID=UPI000A69ABE2